MPPKKAAPSTSKPTSKTSTKPAASKPKSKTTTTSTTTTAAAATAKKTTGTKAAKGAAKPAPKTEDKAEDPPQQVPTCSLKEISTVILNDSTKQIAESGKWPLIIDNHGQVGTFLRHRDVNYLSALHQGDMEAETLRKAVIGSIRFGKPLLLDMMEADLFESSSLKFDDVQKGLFDSILDKSILQEENYMKLVKDSDGSEYHINSFGFVQDFNFFILTTHQSPPPALMKRTYPIRVE